jgi:PAS domain S-box-containing protein
MARQDHARATGRPARADGDLVMAAFDQAPLGIALLDLDGRILRANSALAAVHARPRGQLEGMSWQELVHPDDAPGTDALVRSALAGELEHAQVDARCVHPDGTVILVRAWARLMRDEDGRASHFIAHMRDITEQRRLRADVERLWEMSADYVALADFTGTLLRANPALRRALGLAITPDEIPAAAWIARVHPEDMPGVRDARRRAVREGIETTDLECRVSDPGGGWRWTLWSARIDAPGERIYLVGKDITARKRGEADRAQLAAIVGGAAEAVVSVDTDNRVTTWNKAAERFFGRPAAEALGRHAFDVIVPDDLELVLERFRATIGGADQAAREFTTTRADGVVLHLEVTASPVRDEHGAVAGAALIFRDITERRNAQELSRRLASIVDQSYDAIMAFDVEGRITSWNSAAERIYRRPASEVIGRHAWELAHVDDPETIRERLLAILTEGSSRTTSAVHRRGDGTPVVVEATVFPLLDHAGRPAGASLIARDITERQAAARDAAMLAAIVANTQVAVIATDPDDIVTAWNPAAEQIFGWPAAEMVGCSFERLVPPEDRPRSQEMLDRALHGEPMSYESRRLRRDGTMIDVATSLAPMLGTDGEVAAVATVVQDVTDRRRAERAAAEERGRLAAILDHVPSIVFLKDPESRLVMINDEFCRFFGRSEEELLGTRSDALVEPELGARFIATDREIARTGQPTSEEQELRDHTGALHQFLTVKFPVYAADGRFEGIGAFATDITPINDAQRDRAQLAAIVQSSSDAIVAVAPDGTMLAWNDGAQRLLGRTAQERVGTRVPDVVPEWLSQEIMAIVGSVLDGALVQGRRMDLAHANGHRIPVSLSAAAMRDEDGVAYAVSIIARDVSDLVEAEQTLSTRARALARSNADLEAFAYAASHDLQEPLRVIALAADVIKAAEGERIASDSREMLELVLASARRMSEQIDGLLALARIGQAPRATGPASADSALDAALDALRVSISDSRATIVREPLGEVLVNAAQLTTVLQNLLSNAIKFARPGEAPHITISATRCDATTVHIAVADRGVGIEPRDRERIFRVFQRGGDRSTPGAGIGLAVVRTIVERHGGSLEVDSEPGAGATFTFCLPAPPAG